MQKLMTLKIALCAAALTVWAFVRRSVSGFGQLRLSATGRAG